MNIRAIALLLTLFLSASIAQGQNNVNYNLNSMVIQGEASGGNILSDDMGLGLGIGYDFPFANPRFEFAVKADYVQVNIDYIADGDPSSIAAMSGTISHFSATGGLNVYLGNNHDKANLYRPFRPYVFVLTGLAVQSNQLSASTNFGIPMVQGTLILPLAELGIGAKTRINAVWAFNTSIGIRSTFSDDVDGLIGQTSVPDIIGIVRIGVSKRI